MKTRFPKATRCPAVGGRVLCRTRFSNPEALYQQQVHRSHLSRKHQATFASDNFKRAICYLGSQILVQSWDKWDQAAFFFPPVLFSLSYLKNKTKHKKKTQNQTKPRKMLQTSNSSLSFSLTGLARGDYTFGRLNREGGQEFHFPFNLRFLQLFDCKSHLSVSLAGYPTPQQGVSMLCKSLQDGTK